MGAEILGYSYLNPEDYWAWDDNEDGSSTARNLLPSDEWNCDECREGIGWQTWHTNTYSVIRWTDVYVEDGKDATDEDTLRICEDCRWGE